MDCYVDLETCCGVQQYLHCSEQQARPSSTGGLFTASSRLLLEDNRTSSPGTSTSGLHAASCGGGLLGQHRNSRSAFCLIIHDQAPYHGQTN
jgi:hypothetical protein